MLTFAFCSPDQVSRYSHDIIRAHLGLSKEYILPKDITGRPLPIDNHFYSISHSDGQVFVGVDINPLGVDIEEMKIRDESVLDWHSKSDWSILKNRDWKSFYSLWSAKESTIKCLGGVLDDTKRVALQEKRSIMRTIDLISFSEELIVSYNSVILSVFIGFRDNFIYSFTSSTCENTELL